MLQKRHGCVVLNQCFARAVVVFVACCCAHQQLSRCTTRGLRSGCAGKQNSARAFSGFELMEDSLARHTLVAEVLRTGWHAWRGRSLAGAGSCAAPIDVGRVIPPRRPGTSPRDAVGAPRSMLGGQSQSASPGIVFVAFRRSGPTTGIDNGVRAWASRRPIFDRRAGRRGQPPPRMIQTRRTGGPVTRCRPYRRRLCEGVFNFCPLGSS